MKNEMCKEKASPEASVDRPQPGARQGEKDVTPINNAPDEGELSDACDYW
jgi:hypothetical protein